MKIKNIFIYKTIAFTLAGSSWFFLLLGFGTTLFPAGLFLGLSLLTIQNKTNFKLKVILFNVFTSLFLLSSALTLLNLVRRIQINTNEFKTQYISSTRKPISPYIKSKLLGYENTPNAKIVALKKSYAGDKVSFNSVYSINSFGNRVSIAPETKTINSVLFLGGSLTFGTGLDDASTLPSLFSALTEINSINAGVSGYGIHQAYTILKNKDIYKRKSENRKVSVIVYRMLTNHINRAGGHVSWDANGPCYKLNTSTGKIMPMGSFKDCKARNNFLNSINFYIRKEPLTSGILRQIRIRNYRSNIFNKDDTKLTESMLTEMNRIAIRNKAVFVVILEDFHRKLADPSCKIAPYSSELKKFLKGSVIKVLYSSDFLSEKECNAGNYDIKYDGHPTEKRNYATAKALKSFINDNELMP